MVRLSPVIRIGLVLTAAAVLAAGALLACLLPYDGPDVAAANWRALQPGQPAVDRAAAAIGAGRTYQVSLIPTAYMAQAMWLIFAVIAAALLAASARYGFRPALPSGRAVIARTRDGAAGSVISLLTGLAVFIAGSGHSVRADEWAGDTQEAASGLAQPASRQVQHASGRIRAAVLIRAESDIAPHLDAVLRSRWRPLAILGVVFAVPVAMVISRQGIYGLVVNAENLAVIGGMLYGALHALRRWRGIKPSKRNQRDRSEP